MGEVFTLRYRMSSKDEFYGGGVVNGSRSITLMGDLADQIAAKHFGNTGRCVGVPNVRLFNPVYAGNYMEFQGKITEEKDGEILIEVRSFIVVVPAEGAFASSVDILEDPILSTAVKFRYVSR